MSTDESHRQSSDGVAVAPASREYGMGRGKVFPASDAASLVNPLRRLVQSPRRTVAAMGLGSTDRVLEVGAGPGFFTPSLATAAERGSVVVLDLQREMLVRARQRTAGSSHVAVTEADATALPYRNGAFDAVLLATMLGEVPDAERCVREVRRVLRHGGVACVSETRRDSDFIPLVALRDLFEANGFALLGRAGVRWQYLARFEAV